MKIVCSWCSKTIRDGNGPITHSVCTQCERDVEAEIAREDRPFPTRSLGSYILSVLAFPLRGLSKWS